MSRLGKEPKIPTGEEPTKLAEEGVVDSQTFNVGAFINSTYLVAPFYEVG